MYLLSLKVSVFKDSIPAATQKLNKNIFFFHLTATSQTEHVHLHGTFPGASK